MIIVRAPLRISFVGGGTDLRAFYSISPGRVISTAIDKYVFTVVNPTPLVKRVVARYSAVEVVSHARELKNDRMREALLDFGIENNIELGTFSHMHLGTGLGGSSSFAVALMKGLNAAQGKRIDKEEAARAACRLEIELLKEPIGKQDQYAAAFGGLNVLQFNPDDSVDVDPMLLDFRRRLDFEDHLLLFFTGITRSASQILAQQNVHIAENIDVMKKMADSVFEFRDRLLAGDFHELGSMLHQGWLQKKSLASMISNPIVDELYAEGVRQGAWGGKLLGAGGGGCLLFMVPPEKKSMVHEGLQAVAGKHHLDDSQEIPFHLVQSGVEIVSNSIYADEL